MVVGVLGAGTMGSGIVQVAAQNGHKVVLVDLNESWQVNSDNILLSVNQRLAISILDNFLSDIEEYYYE